MRFSIPSNIRRRLFSFSICEITPETASTIRLDAVLSADGADLGAEGVGAPKAVKVPNNNQVDIARSDDAHQLGKLGAVGAELVQPVVVSAVTLYGHLADHFPFAPLTEVAAHLELLGDTVLLLRSLSPSGYGGDYDGTHQDTPLFSCI